MQHKEGCFSPAIGRDSDTVAVRLEQPRQIVVPHYPSVEVPTGGSVSLPCPRSGSSENLPEHGAARR